MIYEETLSDANHYITKYFQRVADVSFYQKYQQPKISFSFNNKKVITRIDYETLL